MAYDFDNIARTYDRLNRVMTLGLDRHWRRRAAHEVESEEWRVENVLDVACGTGDMVLELKKRGFNVTGVDLSEEMLAIAKRKVESVQCSVFSVQCSVADAECLPFEDDTFDAVTCDFGVRNFVHLEQGLSEMLRVLKSGGIMVILELATPDSKLIRPFYNLYTRHIIPWLGSRIAGNRDAYTYLPESIERFPKGDAFVSIVEKLGGRTKERRFTFGVCRMYIVEKQRGRTA